MQTCDCFRENSSLRKLALATITSSLGSNMYVIEDGGPPSRTMTGSLAQTEFGDSVTASNQFYRIQLSNQL